MIVNIVSAGGLTQIAGPSAVTVMKNFKFGIFKLASLEVLLADWGRDEVNVILQTTISNAFSWMKIYWFRLTKTIPKGSITNIPAPVQTILWTNDDYFSDVYMRRSSSMSHPVNGLIPKISKGPVVRSFDIFCRSIVQSLEWIIDWPVVWDSTMPLEDIIIMG